MSHRPKHDEEESSATPHARKKAESVGTVRPSERVPGKFEVVRADGTVDPYAYRTEEDARKALEG